MTAPEFSARVAFLPTEQGGRTHPVATGYRVGMFFHPESNEGNDGILTLVDKDRCYPSEECVARIRPLFPELVQPLVHPGAVFEVREGRRVIGTGTVLDEFADPA